MDGPSSFTDCVVIHIFRTFTHSHLPAISAQIPVALTFLRCYAYESIKIAKQIAYYLCIVVSILRLTTSSATRAKSFLISHTSSKNMIPASILSQSDHLNYGVVYQIVSYRS